MSATGPLRGRLRAVRVSAVTRTSGGGEVALRCDSPSTRMVPNGRTKMNASVVDAVSSEDVVLDDLLDGLADELLSASDAPSYMTSMCHGGGGSTT
jgi:hypothetical protein